MLLHAPVFTKIIQAQRHYMHIFYTELHPNRAMNVECTRTDGN